MLARLVGKTFMLSTNLSGPQLICKHFSPDLQRTRRVLLYVLLDGDPAIVDPNRRTEDIDFLEDTAVLLQNQADQSHGFAGLAGAEENACAWDQRHHGVRGLFAAVFWRGEYRLLKWLRLGR